MRNDTHARFSGRIDTVTFEALEPRQFLAGDVLAQIVGGSLVVTGDDAANAITITQQGLAAGEVQVTPAPGTTVNGGADPVVLQTLRPDVRIDLGLGDDTITVTQVNLGKLLLNIGNDNDAVALSSVNLTQLCLAGGYGDFGLTLEDSVISGNASIISQGGNAAITFQGDDSRVGGRFQVCGGTGDGTLSITGGQFQKDVRIAAGYGAATITLSGSTIAGKLDITTGTGADDITLPGLTVSGNTKLTLGNGITDVSIDTCTLGGKLDIRSLADADVIDIANSTVVGNVKINAGHGDLTMTADTATFKGNTAICGATGTHSVALSTCTLWGGLAITSGGTLDAALISTQVATQTQGKGGNMMVRTTAGPATVTATDSQVGASFMLTHLKSDASLTLTNTTIAGNLQAKASGGRDMLFLATLNQATISGKTQINSLNKIGVISIDDSTLGGKVDILTGTDVQIECDTTADGVSRFAGAVNIRFGGMDDMLLISGNASEDEFGQYSITTDAAFQAEFAAPVTFDGGKGVDVLMVQLGNGATFAVPPLQKNFEIHSGEGWLL